MMASAAQLKRDLKRCIHPQKAAFYPKFFKTDKGMYGHGDRFLGVVMPDLKRVIKPYLTLDDGQIIKLVSSRWHEERMAGLLIWVHQFERGEAFRKRQIYCLYKKYRKQVNNWDLVDASAPRIIGGYLLDRPRTDLYRWAASPSLFERRIAVIATLAFIRKQDFTTTITLATGLLNDPEDLIHKAVGWMLREVGKREVKVLLSFLDDFAAGMPRTMLRYALERLQGAQRRYYMGIR